MNCCPVLRRMLQTSISVSQVHLTRVRLLATRAGSCLASTAGLGSESRRRLMKESVDYVLERYY